MDYVPGVRPELTAEWERVVSRTGTLAKDAGMYTSCCLSRRPTRNFYPDKPYQECFDYITKLNQDIVTAVVRYAKRYQIEHLDVFYGNVRSPVVSRKYYRW